MIIYGLFSDDANEKRFVAKDAHSFLLTGKNKVNLLDTFVSRGEKKANGWNPPAIEWFEDDGRNLERYRDPDISYITQGAFILGPKASEIIKSTVNDVAELLPIPFNNETWYSLNVYNQVDAFDKANSTYKIYSDGEVGYLLKPAFFPEKVPHAKLFKISEDPAVIYYAEHHSDDNPNTFKNVLEKNKLFGVKLKQMRKY